MKIGYIRISTADQNTARQELLMEQLAFYPLYTGDVLQDGYIDYSYRI